MNHDDLDRMLQHAASSAPLAMPSPLKSAIMARVRVDDGRERRWRSFVRWLLIAAAVSGLVTASVVGWSLASRDMTHSRPPVMPLFQDGTP
jgi:hypothetical protein